MFIETMLRLARFVRKCEILFSLSEKKTRTRTWSRTTWWPCSTSTRAASVSPHICSAASWRPCTRATRCPGVSASGYRLPRTPTCKRTTTLARISRGDTIVITNLFQVERGRADLDVDAGLSHEAGQSAENPGPREAPLCQVHQKQRDRDAASLGQRRDHASDTIPPGSRDGESNGRRYVLKLSRDRGFAYVARDDARSPRPYPIAVPLVGRLSCRAGMGDVKKKKKKISSRFLISFLKNNPWRKRLIWSVTFEIFTFEIRSFFFFFSSRRLSWDTDGRIAGYPHRMRFKAFNARYRLIAPFKQLRRAEEQAVEDTKLILQNAQQLKSKFGASTSWALGKRHIFLSEGIRQQLENLRSETRRKAATVIQVNG